MLPDNNSDALILNVDDSDGARYAKSRILKRAGFKVIEASNGGDALLRARQDRPNLILLDVKLPDINGLEVCRQLKAGAETNTILVLQTSASCIGTADKIRALDGGADNYLVEPIEADELIANVKALLRLGRVERALRDVDRRKDEFLATLAHELRNPLGPIRTALALLCKLDPVVPAMQDNARRTIGRHTSHLVRLVDDLLDVSRISQGKISLQWERVSMASVIRSALETSSHSVEARGHALDVSLPREELWVCGDAVRLSQIVANLLLNAAKFTAPGGRITISAAREDDKVRIRLSDNGIGIAAASIDSIFDLFEQSGHAPDRVQDGLGIGLSLVRKLVTLHGGQVSVHSPGVGLGSTFEVVLPLDAQVPPPAIAPVPETASGGSQRILVVDDNCDAADTLAELLEMYGHTVRTAYTGAQAIERTLEFTPDIVFLDIGLPDMSGYEVAGKLRQLPIPQQFLLVALTGYGQEHDRQTALQAGFNEHFAKPVDFGKLAMLGLHIGP
ncbi:MULTISPECIES: ATP-binding response regulator [unclassified Janthinobacterium]|uniref:ATP-binding response regulator n=1 Tax=unclassified Janthinobacterium TaxID=2610881 RepID=UPI000C714816|nr:MULTISPECIES: response regulator [unclassified Janthinobacterium]PKV44363.1 signal transduction histidine kinase [Janthinobacterium sp. 61]TDY35430.1 signal transduction histidine kinase [Janthinobacterium sp. 75]